MDKTPLVFFDAECLVCNYFGRFLLGHTQDIKLAPIGGSTYHSLPLPPALHGVDSIIFWDGENAYVRSAALRRIGTHMGGLWKFLSLVSRILPGAVIDFFYDRFAAIRYRLFGKVESCALIPKEYRSRVID